MSDITVKDLCAVLKVIPADARVSYHSGEKGGLLVFTAKNGRKTWELMKDGKLVEQK